MRTIFLATVLAAGCSGAQGWTPPPVAADEMQVLSPEIDNIAPGANIVYCSYLAQNVAAETDVIGFHGQQSLGGHHALVYVARKARPVDTHVCTDDDMTNVGYVAGVGADKSLNSFDTLPDGLAFRIPAGAQLMIQTHWLNATPNPITGHAAINLKIAAPSAARQPADLFSVVDTSFDVPAGKTGTATSTCTVGQEVNLFFLGGHEHQWGTHFRAEQVALAGSSTTVYEKDWLAEYEFNPPINIYSVASPLTIKSGESLKITCSWDNTASAKDLTFPTDMCVAWGFYFPGHGEIDCVDGAWPK